MLERAKVAISVIVPVHNSKKYLLECIDSILIQSLKEIEIICIDSSTDGSTEILYNYQKKDNRVQVIEDDNSSYGHKLNEGILRASGEFIAIVESDDYISKDMFEKLYQIGHEYKVDLVKGNYEGFIDTPQKRFFCKIDRIEDSYYGRILMLNEEYRVMPYVGYNIWSGIYRTSFLKDEKIRFHESEGASYQDTGFSNLVTMKAKKIYFLKDYLYKYRLDNQNSSVKSDKKYQCICEEFQWLRSQMKQLNCENNVTKTLFGISKIQSYFWNYQRLSAEYQNKFLECISEDDIEDFDETVLNYCMSNKKYIIKLLKGDKESETYFKRQELEKNNLYQELLNILKSYNRIVIVCAGTYAKAVYKLIKLFECTENIIICDNRPNLVLEGNCVISIEKAVKEYSKAKFIIANKNDVQKLKSQLKDLGIVEEQICLCNKMVIDSEILSMYCKLKACENELRR